MYIKNYFKIFGNFQVAYFPISKKMGARAPRFILVVPEK
jgi:hypothetical protein